MPETMKMMMTVKRKTTLGEVMEPRTAVPTVPTRTMVITSAYMALSTAAAVSCTLGEVYRHSSR